MNNKEVVQAGHALAAAVSMDTPLIEIAKMLAEMATRLDLATVRGDALQQQVNALYSLISQLQPAGNFLAQELFALTDALDDNNGEFFTACETWWALQESAAQLRAGEVSK